MTTLEDYLKDNHAKDYTGTDDDMPGAYEAWLARLDGGDIMGFAEELIEKKNQQIQKLMKLCEESIGALQVIKEMAV